MTYDGTKYFLSLMVVDYHLLYDEKAVYIGGGDNITTEDNHFKFTLELISRFPTLI